MVEVLESEKTKELKTVSVKKDTWILELPDEICDEEGYAKGTLVSLTFKDGDIKSSFIRPPSKKLQEISKQLLKKNHKLYEELKRIGD